MLHLLIIILSITVSIFVFLGLSIPATHKKNQEYKLITVPNYHKEKSVQFYIYDHCIISNELKLGKIWEKHMHQIFEKYVTPKSVVVEAGCHIGSHTLKLALLAQKVIALEPMPESYALLMANLQVNRIDNVTVLERGLSDHAGTAQFAFFGKNNPGGSGLSDNPMGLPPKSVTERHDEIIKVKLITLDSLQLKTLDFLKCDVEGYEEKLIQGAMETIKRCRPIITMEVWSPPFHYGHTDINYTKSTFKNLLDLGYNVTQIYGPDYLFLPKS